MEFNRLQRLVVVVALAGALRALRSWLIAPSARDGGWFNYPPDSGGVFSPGAGWSTGRTFALTIVLILIWLIISIWLLRDNRPAVTPSVPAPPN